MISTAAISSPGQQGRLERAGEDDRRRPRHDDVPVLAPEDIESAAVEHYARLAPGKAAPVRGDERRAGAGAAGAGEADAALPHPQPDVPPVAERGDADIGALGKQRMAFEDRAERGEVDRLNIGDKEGCVRIAD